MGLRLIALAGAAAILAAGFPALALGEEPDVDQTVTATSGRSTTFTVSVPSDRLQCAQGETEENGACTTEHAMSTVSRGACRGPYSLHVAGTDYNDDEDTEADDNRWVDHGGGVEFRGRQMRVEYPADSTPGAVFIDYAMYGTQTVTIDTGHGDVSRESVGCALTGRIKVNIRASASARFNAELRSAQEAARDYAKHRETDYVPPNLHRCRVIRVGNGEMSWCGTLTGENGQEVAPNGEAVSDLCAQDGATCRRN